MRLQILVPSGAEVGLELGGQFVDGGEVDAE
jgi:hypothetical protein